jgi:hypothetical protein
MGASASVSSSSSGAVAMALSKAKDLVSSNPVMVFRSYSFLLLSNAETERDSRRDPRERAKRFV